MAFLQQESTGIFHIGVYHQGKRYKRSARTRNLANAESQRQEIEEVYRLVRTGRIEVPEHVATIDFVFAKGRTSDLPKKKSCSPAKQITLAEAFDLYLETIPDGSLEPGTLKTIGTHRRHLERHIKPNFVLRDLTRSTLQRYINLRARDRTHLVDRAKGKGKDGKYPYKTVQSTTIRKEIVTLGTIWNSLALPEGIVDVPYPNRRLQYPKVEEKSPFQTWDEIERQIKCRALDEDASVELWDALYLRKDEIDSLLNHVKTSHVLPFVYPMIVTAAHTGARRSEIVRSHVNDFDLDTGVLSIRERKRCSSGKTTRQVPITPLLAEAVNHWLTIHPGGEFTFCNIGKAGLTPDQAHSYFKQAVKDSKWNRLRGWHCLRHSFISNLACKNVDQRIIDDLVGHQTDQMRRRYRHLFPEVKKAALESVFG